MQTASITNKEIIFMRRDKNFVLRACIAATLMTAAVNGAMAAEKTFSPTDRETIQEVVITGSYLDGAPEDAALPVTVINEEDIEKQGAPSVLDLVRSIPASQATFGESNAQQVFQGSGGVSVNLRGLESGRTLVLFNSRRLPISPVPLLGVDLNLLPIAAVGRIEVLKDGASSTYGSDAIGGVVNFITKRGFDGLSVEGSYTNIDDSDGDYSTSIVWGRNTDSFDFLFAAGYRHRSELQSVDRSFASRPAAPGVGGLSASGNPGAFTDPLGPILAPGFPNFLDPGCAPLGGVPLPGPVPMCNFRFSNFANIVEREEVYGAYGEFNTRLGDFADLHFEGFYTAHDTPEENSSPSFPNTQGPGATLQQQFGLPVDPTNPPLFRIPVTNPGLAALLPSLAAQTAANIQNAGSVLANGLTFRTLGAGGNPLFENEGLQRSREFDAFRVSAGLKGEIGNIGWDFAVTYGENTNNIRSPLELPARVQLALAGFGGLNCTGTTAGANGCLFLNPFSTGVAANVATGQVNSLTFNPATVNSREVIDFITGTLDLEETTDVLVVDLVFDGDSGVKLPGGNITWAVGAQFREDGFDRELNDLSNRAITPCADSIVNPAATCSFNTGPFGFQSGFTRVNVDDEVYGVFTEFSLPLAEKLQAQLAFRYEDYGGRTGSTSNPKLALRYQATDWLTLRGSASSTFRGPVLTQAQTDILTVFQFVPFFQAVRPFDNFTNPNLQPEEADNFNVGFLINTEKLSLSLDYFQIKLKDKILNENGPDVVAAFFGTPQMPQNNCGRAGFEALQSRFTFTNGTCGINNLLRVRANFVNGPDEEVRGLDYTGTYNLTNVLGGNLLLGVDATYNLEYERDNFFIEGILAPTAGGRDFAGTRGGIQALPELRGSVFTEYNRSIHNVRVTGRYVDGVTDLSPAALTPTGQRDEIASYFTTDIVYRLSMASNLTVTAAVFNVADRDPPRIKNLDLNYDPFFYNPVGRAFKVAVNKRF
jgi:iron complex outermembrane receptor protein